MATRPEDEDDVWLEVIDALPEEGEPMSRAGGGRLPRGRRHRRVRVAVAIAVGGAGVAAVVAAPVRRAMAGRELHDLDVTWQRTVAVADSRDAIERQLSRTATTPDQPRLAAAATALDGEAAAQLAAARRRLQAMRLVDGELRATRSSMVRWADVQAVAWRTHRSELRAPAIQARHVADDKLQHQRDRWHRRAVATVPAPAPFHSADAAMAAVNRYFDEPLGLRLVVTEDTGFSTVDVDGNTHERRVPVTANVNQAGRGPRALVGRDGYVAFISQDSAYAVPPTVTDPAVVLGAATDMFPATRPDAVWLVAGRSGASATLTEVDGRATRLAGPFTVPGHPVGEVDGGVLVARTGGGLLIWEPASGRVVRTLTETGDWAASTHDRVAWLAFDGRGVGRLHVVALDGGRERVLDPGPSTQTGIASFSPDGRTVVTTTLRPDGSQVTTILAMDMASGAVRPLPSDIGRAGIAAMAWTADSTRLFITTSAPLPVFTWRVGDPAVRQLRVTGIRPQGVAVLPAR